MSGDIELEISRLRDPMFGTKRRLQSHADMFSGVAFSLAVKPYIYQDIGD